MLKLHFFSRSIVQFLLCFCFVCSNPLSSDTPHPISQTPTETSATYPDRITKHTEEAESKIKSPYADWLEQSTEKEVKQDSRFSENLIKMFTLLALTLGFMALSLWGIKKLLYNRLSGFKTGSKGRIQILEQRPLSAKSALYIIQVDGKELVIGETQQSGIVVIFPLDSSREL